MEPLKSSDLVRLLLEHRDGLFGFVLALTHDREAAEEIFQEVGLAIVEEAGRQTRVSKFLPWAHEVARRRVAEYFRKNARRRLQQDPDSLGEIVAQAFEEHAASAADREGSLSECLEELPDTQRTMIEQRYHERAPIKAIARTLNWTDGAVKVALWKVRRRLAACMEGKLAEAGGEE